MFSRCSIRLFGTPSGFSGMFSNAFRYDGEQLHLVATTLKSVKALKILADTYPKRPDERQAADEQSSLRRP